MKLRRTSRRIAGVCSILSASAFLLVSAAPTPGSTIAWRPYRTASARLTDEFIQYLARMEGELQRAARDENWAIDWKPLDEAYKRASDLLSRKRLSKALLEFAKVFDLLMVGVHSHRKQIQHESRWGKGSNPSVKARPS